MAHSWACAYAGLTIEFIARASRAAEWSPCGGSPRWGARTGGLSTATRKHLLETFTTPRTLLLPREERPSGGHLKWAEWPVLEGFSVVVELSFSASSTCPHCCTFPSSPVEL